jgi:hypothetical protein
VHGELIDASALPALVAVHRDAVTEARRLKPSIPREADGIPLRHELELRLDL